MIVRNFSGWPAAIMLVILHAFVTLSATQNFCTSFDEIAHLTAGVSYWQFDDYRLQPENGNLPQRWAGLACRTDRFPDLVADWPDANVWRLGEGFFYRNGNDPDAMLWRARSMMVVWPVALGLVVYAWSRSLFGRVGGIMSLLLYVSCPTVLANGPLVTSDACASFFFLVAAGTWWRLLKQPSIVAFIACALALGGLFLAKFSAVLFLPIGLVLLVAQWRRSPTARTMAKYLSLGVGLIAITALLIWAAFGFRYSAFQDDGQFFIPWDQVSNPGATGLAVDIMRKHQLLPESYLYGFAFSVKMSQSRVAFLNGEIGYSGWRHFFLYTFAVKTPISTLIVLGLAAIILGRRRQLFELLPLLALVGIYGFVALLSHLNIGHRHLLPIYAPLFILAGVTMTSTRLVKVVTGMMAVIMVAVSATVYPHFLAYFNEFAGGSRNGYRHLVDSSLDWGQDLPGLKRWLDHHAEPGVPVYLSYFGTGSPRHYGINATLLPCFFDQDPGDARTAPGPLRPGLYCISATMLQGLFTRDRDDAVAFNQLCEQLRRRPPDDHAGYSILIYRVTADELPP